MPQNEFIERHRKLFGRKLDWNFRHIKKERRQFKKDAKLARKLHGRRAKQLTKKRYKQKIELKKNKSMHIKRKKINTKMNKQHQKEQYLHICWTEKEFPVQRYCPTQ